MALYDTYELLPVLERQKTITPFWLNMFTRTITFDTEQILFDKVFTDRRFLAPFVAPNVQGRVMGMSGYESRTFKPAYVKPKHVVDPNMIIPRMPGETLGTGSMTLMQRRDAVVAEILRQHRDLHTNRQEWMAARAVIDGKVTVESPDYPSTLVDFRRDASLTSVLAGAAQWNGVSADPLANLRALRKQANNLSGARVTSYIFGEDAYDMFASKVNLKEMMNLQYGGQTTSVSLIREGVEGIEFMGRIAGLDGKGSMDLYVDTSKYRDPTTGAETFFLDQKTVVGVAPQSIQGVRCFGAIKDKDASYRAIEMFPKMWDEKDPPVEYIMTQSAPLMVPVEPNASFSIKVAA
jgi:hypothetical protein